MPFTKYSKWNGVDWESLSLEDLMDRLSEFLLDSGFDDPYFMYRDEQDDSLESLRDAIMRALLEDGLLTDEELEKFYDEQGNLKMEAMNELIDRLLERLAEEGYLRFEEQQTGSPRETEVTSKGGQT